MTPGWVNPRYIGAVVALAWAQAQAQALREEKGEDTTPCRPCSGAGAAVLTDGQGTTYVLRCGACTGTGNRPATPTSHPIHRRN